VPEQWLNQAMVDDRPDRAPLVGVAPAVVISNSDSTGQGRVQLQLPWLPDVQPWARVATPSAGPGRGMYFIPQVDDEVLVAFGHGDLTEPYVLGSLWGPADKPPQTGDKDPVNHRVIRTPEGHVLDFDDKEQSVTLTTIPGHSITITPDSIVVQTSNGTASLTLGNDGSLSISALQSITLNAPQINISGTTLSIQGDGTVQIQGGGTCAIQAGIVTIN
jgi:uncharacterized protein involved in type VI secretion and phage assembly